MPPLPSDFDPDAPADAEGGLFGLTTSPEEAGVRVLGLPFDATTSYRRGTALGPAAVLAASHQIDLLDVQQRDWTGGDGRPWAAGVHFELDEQVATWNEEAVPLATAIIERGGRIGDDATLLRSIERVEAIGTALNDRVEAWTAARLAAGQIPALLGGDHSVPLGALVAAARAHPGLGVLHVDAHADLRPAFEGFRWSHASILHNVLAEAPGLGQVLSIGLRDLGEVELARLDASAGSVRPIFGHAWAALRARGADLVEVVAKEIARLPDEVWITFDIDGLEPAWCPNTGTPVPGGLTWDEALLWIGGVVDSGRRIVGFDLCEVGPGEAPQTDTDGWDAIVGARLLYKLIGAAVASRRG